MVVLAKVHVERDMRNDAGWLHRYHTMCCAQARKHLVHGWWSLPFGGRKKITPMGKVCLWSWESTGTTPRALAMLSWWEIWWQNKINNNHTTIKKHWIKSDSRKTTTKQQTQLCSASLMAPILAERCFSMGGPAGFCNCYPPLIIGKLALQNKQTPLAVMAWRVIFRFWSITNFFPQ